MCEAILKSIVNKNNENNIFCLSMNCNKKIA